MKTNTAFRRTVVGKWHETGSVATGQGYIEVWLLHLAMMSSVLSSPVKYLSKGT